MNIYLKETSDNKFHIIQLVPTLIETNHSYTLENKERTLKTFDTFEEASDWAREYYNKEVKQ